MEIGWKRDAKVIAERFAKDDLPGFLKKEFVAKENESIVLEKKREIYLERGPGKMVINHFMKDFTDIILIDKTEKTLEKTIKKVCLADSENAEIKLLIKFRIFNADHFSKRLLGERKKLFLEDIWNEAFSDIMCRKILPQLEKKTAAELLRDAGKGVKAKIEEGIKNRFKEWGLIITLLSVNLNLPEANADVVEEEPDALEAKPRRATLEDEMDELEKERVEKDVRMELEKKQAQRDMEEAMEALELKGIMVKERELKEAEGKEKDKEKLEEELETLQKAKEVTERKFYKKELSEDSFQRMMEDLEKRIIEIETKLKRQK
jgi:hypothetical protein